MKNWMILFFLMIGFVSAGNSYYVDCSRSTNGDGSLNNPWNNVASVNNYPMQTGDDVYFKVGTTCVLKSGTSNMRLYVDWTGTSEDRVEIGAYYVNGNIPEHRLDGRPRPIIDGDAQTYPLYSYQGAISIKGVQSAWNNNSGSSHYITIKDIHVVNSGGTAIRSEGPDYIIVENCYLENSKVGGITVIKSHDSIIQNNVVDKAGKDGCTAGIMVGSNGMAGDGSDVKTFPDYNNLIRNNTVHGVTCEGIGLYRIGYNTTVENNIVYDCKNVGIYLDWYAFSTIRNNIVYSSGKADCYRCGNNRRMWQCIQINVEDARCDEGAFPDESDSKSDSHKIYGNLVAGCSNGISIGGSDCDHSRNDNLIYNNIFIDNDENIGFYKDTSQFSGNKVINNIFYLTNTSLAYSRNYNPNGVLWDHNLFYGDGSVSGNAANNAVFFDPEIIKKNGWRDLPAGLVDADYFRLRDDSPVVDAGINLGNEFAKDFFGKTRGADGGWDIGAVEYGGQTSQRTCRDLGGVCCSACAGSAISGASDCVTCCSACRVVSDSSYEIVKGHAFVDGYVSEFSKANEIVIDDLNPAVGLSRGSVGKYRLMWDDLGLYISGEVADSEVNSEIGVRDGNLWEDDSLEIMFDVLNEGGVVRDGNDYKFIVNSDGVALDHRGSEGISWDIDFDSAVRVVDGGYVVEVAIPWSAWGVGVSENDVWGMEVAMNDRDDDGVRTQSAWINTENALVNRPSTWGDVVFVGGGSVSLDDVFAKIDEWKRGEVSLADVLGVVRAWGRSG